MHKEELPYWLQSVIICGRENDEGDEGGEGEGDDGEDDGEEGEGEGGDGDNSDNHSDDGEDTDDPAKLKEKLAAKERALREERRLRRKAERESRKAGKARKSQEKKPEDDPEVQQRLQSAEDKAKRLAEGLRRREIDTAIIDEARRQGFIDPTDALLDDIRREIDVDQDEDDPTDIDVDRESVRDAVKDLADRKKHLVGKGTPGEPSGGKFRRKSAPETPNPDALTVHYPSLR